MPDILDICEKAARAGAEQLLERYDDPQAWEKGPRDLVTEADLASQREIERIVGTAFPDHAFLGEEGDQGSPDEQLARLKSGYCWIVDPLDGTVNYAHGLPNFSVSVGVAHRGRVLAGVILDPISGECFRAERGQGADLNGQPLQASACQQLDQALVAASFPSQVDRASLEIQRFIEVLLECQSVRRLGSSALNMCYVAAGRLDAYWSTTVKIWDIAAGVVIVQEAGGQVTDLSGAEFILERPEFVAAATPALLARMVEVLKRVAANGIA